MGSKVDFRARLDQLADGVTRQELERIYNAACENAEEYDDDDDAADETAFEMTVENERDDATGDVRKFLDDLLHSSPGE